MLFSQSLLFYPSWTIMKIHCWHIFSPPDLYPLKSYMYCSIVQPIMLKMIVEKPTLLYNYVLLQKRNKKEIKEFLFMLKTCKTYLWQLLIYTTVNSSIEACLVFNFWTFEAVRVFASFYWIKVQNFPNFFQSYTEEFTLYVLRLHIKIARILLIYVFSYAQKSSFGFCLMQFWYKTIFIRKFQKIYWSWPGSSLFSYINGGFIFEMLLLLCKLVRHLNVKLQNANWGAQYMRAFQKGGSGFIGFKRL